MPLTPTHTFKGIAVVMPEVTDNTPLDFEAFIPIIQANRNARSSCALEDSYKTVHNLPLEF